jgi:hypothetical protein
VKEVLIARVPVLARADFVSLPESQDTYCWLKTGLHFSYPRIYDRSLDKIVLVFLEVSQISGRQLVGALLVFPALSWLSPASFLFEFL